MSKIAISCAHCGAQALKEVGAVNRSRNQGKPLYCGKVCFGLANRKHLTAEQRRANKAEYDRQRRAALGEDLLAEKRAAYYASLAADPYRVRAAQKALRERRMPKHVEYCRQPEYRAWKSEYDRQYRAKRDFGPFAEAALVLLDVEKEISSRVDWVELQRQKGTLNKPLQRKRDYAKRSIPETVRSEPQGRAVGNPPVDPQRLDAAGRR